MSATRITIVAALFLLAASPALGQRHVRDICRVKGQEENTLHGLGLVVGLKGTGDGEARPTARALARMLELMGSPLPQSREGLPSLDELEDARNVAMVFVTATVPAEGARQGSRIDCQVSAINAKSLDGGYLMMTALVGPNPADRRVYAFCQGQLHLEDASLPATAKIHRGCRLEHDFFNLYHREDERGKVVTLVLDRDHATWQTAAEVVELINSQPDFRGDVGNSESIATALDQVNIEVRVPEQYEQDVVSFVSILLGIRVLNLDSNARVVINERAGTVVIGADVEIGAVAITHKNMVIEAGASGPFVSVDPEGAAAPRLKTLVEALNALQVPTSDVIEIIKSLERNGKIYGKVIVE